MKTNATHGIKQEETIGPDIEESAQNDKIKEKSKEDGSGCIHGQIIFGQTVFVTEAWNTSIEFGGRTFQQNYTDLYELIYNHLLKTASGLLKSLNLKFVVKIKNKY